MNNALSIDMNNRNYGLVKIYSTIEVPFQECGTCPSMHSSGLFFECFSCKERFCKYPCFNSHYESCEGA